MKYLDVTAFVLDDDDEELVAFCGTLECWIVFV